MISFYASHHEAAPLLGVADAEHDDGEEDGAHGDAGDHGSGDPRLPHVHLPASAVGAVGRHDDFTEIGVTTKWFAK